MSSKAFVIVRVRRVQDRREMGDYLDLASRSIKRHGGRWLVSADTPVRVMDGDWSGTVAVIEFPDTASATTWYESSDYQSIIGARFSNTDSSLCVVAGVPPL